MCYLAFFLAILLLVPLSSLAAAVQDSVSVDPGDRVRVTAPGLGIRAQEGRLQLLSADSVVIRAEDGEVGRMVIPVRSLTRFELLRGNPLNETGALVGAAIGGGLALGALGTLVVVRNESLAKEQVLLPLWGVAAGTLLGSGASARKGALWGFLVGAAVGAGAGQLYCYIREDCEEYAIVVMAASAGVGGGAGVVVGGTVGLATGRERWEEVPIDRLRVSILPQTNGQMAISLSLMF